MDAEVVQQFINFFQDFIDLCQWNNWPNNNTTEIELKNAFLISQHVEKCLDKFQKNSTLDEFLASLNLGQDSTTFLKNCLIDPTKYILKKIINSNTKLSEMDLAFKIFLQLFTEEKLASYLTDLIVEASSKEVLLNNLSAEIPKDDILKFQSEIFLSQVNVDTKKCVEEMLMDCNQDSLKLIIVSLGLTEPKFHKSVNIVSECMLDVLLNRNNHLKSFWKCLFNIDDKYLIKMCVENGDLYYHICEALIDCGKLLKENMSAEYFYIEFTDLELDGITKRLFSDEHLKSQFIDILNDHGVDVIDFWQSFL